MITAKRQACMIQNNQTEVQSSTHSDLEIQAYEQSVLVVIHCLLSHWCDCTYVPFMGVPLPNSAYDPSLRLWAVLEVNSAGDYMLHEPVSLKWMMQLPLSCSPCALRVCMLLTLQLECHYSWVWSNLGFNWAVIDCPINLSTFGMGYIFTCDGSQVDIS